MKNFVKLKDETSIPILGQGTWYMGENSVKRESEIKTLRLGVELGMTLIDTAEMYGDGRSEELVGEALNKYRDKIFLISKVYPHNAGLKNIEISCERSLRRLKTDHLDLYLLHWRGGIPLKETIDGMERLVKSGKILRWGVSNFDKSDMEELLSYDNGDHCTVNEVLYHLGSRGIEFDLIPWQKKHNIPVIAYCPIAQAGKLRKQLLKSRTVIEIARENDVKPIEILLSWCLRSREIIAIPKASTEEHVKENAHAGEIQLSKEQLDRLDTAFPAPRTKLPLDIV